MSKDNLKRLTKRISALTLATACIFSQVPTSGLDGSLSWINNIGLQMVKADDLTWTDANTDKRVAEGSNYTDDNGVTYTYNTYDMDNDGLGETVIISSITLNNATKLIVPETINGMKVTQLGVLNASNDGQYNEGIGTEEFITDYNSNLQEIYVNTPTICNYVFSGNDTRAINTLTVGPNVKHFILGTNCDNWHNNKRQHFFNNINIDTLNYNATEIDSENIFENDTIGTINFGDNVKVIPEGCFRGCTIDGDLTINIPTIKANAFNSDKITLNSLTIGENVTNISNNYTFYKNTIETLNYNATNAITYEVHPNDSSYLLYQTYAPFQDATINSLNIGSNVTSLPNSIFARSIMHLSDLTVDVPSIGYAAFGGDKITIDNLTITENVKTFVAKLLNAETFKDNTIGTINYNAIDADLDETSLTKFAEKKDSYEYGWYSNNEGLGYNGIFSEAKVSNLNISNNTKVIPTTFFTKTQYTTETLSLNAEKIGAYAFTPYNTYKSENVYDSSLKINNLILNDSVKTLGPQAFSWCFFDDVTINNPNITSNKVKANPFYNTRISKLDLVENMNIDDYMFNASYLDLKADNPITLNGTIGEHAFDGKNGNIHIANLVLGNNSSVTTNRDRKRSNDSAFKNTTIDDLTVDINVDNWFGLKRTDANYPENNRYAKPFYDATINNFNIGANCNGITAYMFAHSKLKQNDYVFNVPLGNYSFEDCGLCGSNEVSSLDDAKINLTFNSGVTYYGAQFANANLQYGTKYINSITINGANQANDIINNFDTYYKNTVTISKDTVLDTMLSDTNVENTKNTYVYPLSTTDNSKFDYSFAYDYDSEVTDVNLYAHKSLISTIPNGENTYTNSSENSNGKTYTFTEHSLCNKDIDKGNHSYYTLHNDIDLSNFSANPYRYVAYAGQSITLDELKNVFNKYCNTSNVWDNLLKNLSLTKENSHEYECSECHNVDNFDKTSSDAYTVVYETADDTTPFTDVQIVDKNADATSPTNIADNGNRKFVKWNNVQGKTTDVTQNALIKAQYTYQITVYDNNNEVIKTIQAKDGDNVYDKLPKAPKVENKKFSMWTVSNSNGNVNIDNLKSVDGDYNVTATYTDCSHDKKTKVSEQAATCLESGLITYTCDDCDATIEETTQPLGHIEGEVQKENEVDATCTEQGHYDAVVYCTREENGCGHRELSRETIYTDALGHTPGEAVIENRVDSTCTQEGHYDTVVYCTRCNEEISRDTISLDKKAHTPGTPTRELENAATCTENGSYYEVIKCTVCGEEISREFKTTPPTGHTKDEGTKENIVSPTCTEKGHYDLVYKCTKCGAEIKRETIETDALGHKASNLEECTTHENVVPVTCTTDGSYDEVVRCDRYNDKGNGVSEKCNAIISSNHHTVKATGHTPGMPVQENLVNATELTDGSYDEVIYCTTCHEELSRVHKIIPHTHTEHNGTNPTVENYVSATCLNSGSYDEVLRCDVCNAEISRTHCTIAPLGHIEGTPVQENVVNPTCEEKGHYDEVTYCTREENGCNFSEIKRETVETDALGHTQGDYNLVKTEYPTCTENGYEKYEAKCTVCGKVVNSYTNVLEKTGHNPYSVVENEVDATCTEEGHYNLITKCSKCDEVLDNQYVTVPATGHTPGEVATEGYIDATCTAEGGYDEVTYCTKCGTELTREHHIIPKKAHVPGTPVIENKVEATNNKDGSYDEVIYCTLCNTELSRTHKTIAHNHKHIEGNVTIENEVKATCTTSGSYDTVIYCTDCGKEISRTTTTIQPLGHIENAPVVENRVEATCDKDGGYDEVVYCGREENGCNHSELSRTHIVIPKLNHKDTHTVIENTKDATCTEKGSYDIITICDDCGEEVNRKTVETEALGHIESDIQIEHRIEATCSREGSYDEVVYCTREINGCGKRELSRITKKIPKLNHTPETKIQNEIKATCTTDGSYDEVVYCKVCGEIISETHKTTNKLGHMPADAVIENYVEATNNDDGSYDEVIYCKRCNEELSRIHKIIKHNHKHIATEPVIENTVDADCVNSGSYDTVIYCKDCNKEISRVTTTVNPLGHIEGKPVIENKVEATCNKVGGYDTVIYCDRCNTELSRVHTVIPMKDHENITKRKENKIEATCTTEGSYDEVTWCNDCNKEIDRKTIKIPALGHIASDKQIINYVTPTCDKDGGYDVITVCERDVNGCNHSELSREHITLKKTEHIADSPVEENYKAPTCTEKGSKDIVIYCKNCHKEISRNTVSIEALGHDYKLTEDIKATCTTKGYKKYVCQNDKSHTYTEYTDKLEHTKDTPIIENKVEADCTNNGKYDEVIYCKDCHTELSRKTIITQPLGHIYPKNPIIENKIEATTKSEGSYDEVWYCDRCKAELKRVNHIIPKLEDNTPTPEPKPQPETKPDEKPEVKPEVTPTPKPDTPVIPDEVPTPQPTPDVPKDNPTPSPIIPDNTNDVEPEEIPEVTPTIPDSEENVISDDDTEKVEKEDTAKKTNKEEPKKTEEKTDDKSNKALIPIVVGSLVGLTTAGSGLLFFLIFKRRKRKVTGTIITNNDEKLNISLVGKDDLSTTTDDDGYFEFTNLKKDEYVFTITNSIDEILFSANIDLTEKDTDDTEKVFDVIVNNVKNASLDVDGKTYNINIIK